MWLQVLASIRQASCRAGHDKEETSQTHNTKPELGGIRPGNPLQVGEGGFSSYDSQHGKGLPMTICKITDEKCQYDTQWARLGVFYLDIVKMLLSPSIFQSNCIARLRCISPIAYVQDLSIVTHDTCLRYLEIWCLEQVKVETRRCGPAGQALHISNSWLIVASRYLIKHT